VPVVSTPPVSDDIELTTQLGIKGYIDDVPLAQFIRWGLESGLLEELAGVEAASAEDISTRTWLTPVGADVLLGVYVATGLAQRQGHLYRATPLLTEYLAPHSPYYIGDSLVFATLPVRLPARFVDRNHPESRSVRGRARLLVQRVSWKLIRAISRRSTSMDKTWHLGGRQRLENQHQRNLPAGVAAANMPLFATASCVVDVGGGTGTLALALKQLHPHTRVVITDLPEALDGIERFLDAQGRHEIEVQPMDVADDEWAIPDCDVMYFGNLLHVFDDRMTARVIERTAAHLVGSGGGTIVIHELVWNPERTGPLKAALFDFTMRSFGGRQRTVAEFQSMLEKAGFDELGVTPTRGGFVAIVGTISA